MTIKTRIIASSAIFLTLIAILVVANWYGNKSVMLRTTDAYLFKDGTMRLQGILRGINEFIIDEGEPISIELIETHLNAFDKISNNLSTSISDPELKKALTLEIQPKWKIVKEGTQSFVKSNPYISVEDDAAMLEYGKLSTEARELYEAVNMIALKTASVAGTTAARTHDIVNTVAVLVMLMISGLLFDIYRCISRPIKELGVMANKYADGDLSVVLNSSRKDEFGSLANNFNKATEKLNSLVLNIKRFSRTLTVSSEQLSESTSAIINNTGEQSKATSQVASAIGMLSTSFEDVAKNSSDATLSAKEAAGLAIKGGEIVSGTISGIEKISGTVNRSAEKIEALGESSEQVGNIVKVIDDIAAQTNLLALNAAIEAARAGDQGRGFAVVADEVRELAEKTASATNEIGNMIKGIQNDTAEAVESMQAGTKEVEEGVNLAKEAGEALKQIVASIQSVTEMISHIATAAEEQATTGEEIAATLESVVTKTENTDNAVKDAAESTQELYVLVYQLHDLISGFKSHDIEDTSETNTVDLWLEESTTTAT